MTVQELIEQLMKMPRTSQVVTMDGGMFAYWLPIVSVTEVKEHTVVYQREQTVTYPDTVVLDFDHGD